MAFSTSTTASTTLRAHCYSSSSNRTRFVCSRSGWCLLLLLLLFVVVSEIRLVDGTGGTNTHESHKDDAGTYETDDAVIIEALPDTRKGKRSNDEELIASQTISEVVSRQQTADRFGKHWSALMPLGTIGTCFTSKGVLGQCTPFRQCYPYFKLPELSNWETWILGMYDTCTYYTEQGRQMFGVCCTNPITPKPIAPKPTKPPVVEQVTTEQDKNKEGEEKMTSSAKPSPNGPHQANWPPTHPPLPTHPPDHTIPPLPTHPPSPGFPFVTPESTTPKPVTTTWPSKPTTKPWPTPQWPPTVPTAPPLPTHPPTTPQPWPPTHPPIPTHPPLPTHPPVPTYPTGPPVVPGGQPVVPPITDGTCGAKNGYQDQERIVGGHSADLGEWPWIAALFNGGRQFCGGSLIDNMHILSAAHCVAHMSSWDVARLTVRLGDHNIKTNSEVTHIEKRVKRVVRHRGFDSRTLYNDVAILTLDTPIQFSKLIRPICLPSGGSNYAGKTATVIGWGSLRESGPQPAVLQEVSIPIWTNGECRQKYGPAAPGGIVEHMLCAGQASRDSCSGDSGGPLMVNDGKWTQVGIVSWGIGCGKGQYPGVYTRVTHFLPWITKNLK